MLKGRGYPPMPWKMDRGKAKQVMTTRLASRPKGSKKSSTREILLKAAREALMAGEGAAEMGAIAKRAGVSVGLAYHHFGSKAGLIAAVVEDFYARYTETVNARFEGASWVARERQRTAALVDFFVDEPFARTLLGPLGRSPEVVNAEAGCMAAMIELGARNIASGQQSGELDPDMDPMLAGAFVLGGVRQCLTVALVNQDQPDRQTLAAAAWRHIAHALGAKL